MSNINRQQSMVWVAIALLSGVVFGTAVTSSRFAFDAGASGILVSIIRTVLVVVVLAVWVKLAGARWSLPRGSVKMIILVGILMTASSYGIIGAVEFISVGFASLLFFTFPVVIAVIVMGFRIESFNIPKLLAVVLAFAGLIIMMESSIGNVDWRGTAFAMVASVSTALNAILIARYCQHMSVLVLMLHTSVITLVVLVLIAAMVGDVRLPTDAVGWGGIAGVGILHALGMPMFYSAVGRIGALKASMAINIQPVTSIYEAWILFDEVLSFLQAIGGGLVLASIGIMQWMDLRRESDTPER